MPGSRSPIWAHRTSCAMPSAPRISLSPTAPGNGCSRRAAEASDGLMQLVLPIEPRHKLTRADFIAAPGNERALAFLESWPSWPALAAVLHGPAAAGKSHLVQIWAALSGAAVITAADLVEAPDGAVAVEDIDAMPGDAHERALFALFERGSPLLLTGRT